MRTSSFLLYLALILIPTSAFAQGFELRLGLETLAKDQSNITGMQQLSLLYQTKSGYYLGESLYSSALGSAGGFFAGGVEIGRRGNLGHGLSWDVGQFVGGGGGASQVTGSGLMLRTHAALQFPVGRMNLGLGASWVKISGSDISTPAYGLYLSQPLNLKISTGRSETALVNKSGTEMKAFKPIYSIYLPRSSSKRSGEDLGTMHLVGGELSFASSVHTETFIQANGVGAGDAEGYADWFIGQRYFPTQGRLQPFIEVGLGTAGGGDVETDGGLIIMAGLGARYALTPAMTLEAALGGRCSAEGGFLALAPSIKASIPFAQLGSGKQDEQSVRWQLSTGLALQDPSEDYWKDGKESGSSPVMFETTLDFFLLDHLYLTGQAYTAVSGDAGGYQIGLLGFGYQHNFSKRISFSIEPLIGTGGGAGVETRGGLLLAYRIDVDLWLNERAALSLGFGQMKTGKGGGMSPETYHVGLKFPFSSWH